MNVLRNLEIITMNGYEVRLAVNGETGDTNIILAINKGFAFFGDFDDISQALECAVRWIRENDMALIGVEG